MRKKRKPMTDSERVALHRKRKLWDELKQDGWTSPKELQDEVREADVPWTWNSRRKELPGHVGVEDLLPSRKVVDTLRKRRKASDSGTGGGTGSPGPQGLDAQGKRGGQRSRGASS